jgi:hypothetical protein
VGAAGELTEIQCVYRNVAACKKLHWTGFRDLDDLWASVKQQEGFLQPYRQPDSHENKAAIDGQHEGLYFCGTLVRGALPKTSPYGKQRIIVTLAAAFGPKPKFYYLDSYQVKGNLYLVVLVVTEDFSGSLPEELQPIAAEYFEYDERSGKARYRTGLWLEFYIVGRQVPLAACQNQEGITVTGYNTCTSTTRST